MRSLCVCWCTNAQVTGKTASTLSALIALGQHFFSSVYVSPPVSFGQCPLSLSFLHQLPVGLCASLHFFLYVTHFIVFRLFSWCVRDTPGRLQGSCLLASQITLLFASLYYGERNCDLCSCFALELAADCLALQSTSRRREGGSETT